MVIKWIHDCPIGCVDGLCIGTECGKGETFIMNEKNALAYNNCDIEPVEADNEGDLPGDSFGRMTDFACCSGASEAYCVYEGVCYPSSRTTNYYSLGDEIAACGCKDASCSFEDGNHRGQWFDLDSNKDICEGGTGECNRKWYTETGFRWIKPGIELSESPGWEYEDMEAECCGDDSSEYVICEGETCICCNSADSGIKDGKCSKVETQPEPANVQPEITKPETTKPETTEEIEITEPEEKGIKMYVIVPVTIAIISVLAILIFGRRKIELSEKEE